MMSCVQIDAGPSFACNRQDTLLKAALREGIGFPYECHSGGCGACKFDLLEGEVTSIWPEAPGLTERERLRGKRLACQTMVSGDSRIKVRTSDEYVPLVNPKRVQATLTAVRHLTHDMAEFTFRSASAAHFLPGQFALLLLPRLGLQRAYSMSNVKNDEGVWQFVVRRVPNGAVSSHLFDELEMGATIELDGPYGLAWMRPLERDLICIAGGSGLAPMLSIAQAASPLLEQTGKALHFYSGVRTTRDLIAQSELKELTANTANVRCTEVVSHAADESIWGGPTGFVHEEIDKVFGDSLANYEIYFAGPPPMAQALLDLLMLRRGVPYSQIHFDRFF